MIWNPFLLVLALGLVVAAGVYLAYRWLRVEPEDPSVEPKLASTAEHFGEPDKIVWPDMPADEEPEVPPPSVAA